MILIAVKVLGAIIIAALVAALVAYLIVSHKEAQQTTKMEANGKTYQKGDVNILVKEDTYTNTTTRRIKHDR